LYCIANLPKTLRTNFYQNWSTVAEVMHKSILVCSLRTTVYKSTLVIGLYVKKLANRQRFVMSPLPVDCWNCCND